MPVNQRKAGAALSYVALGVNVATSFSYVPVLLGVLTVAQYGVYELIGSLIAYLSVMDMGLSTTLSRFYVREQALEDSRSVENLLAMAALIYGALTGLSLLACVGMNALIDPVFGARFSAQELESAHSMMLLVALNCLFVLPGNWFLALINANERFVFARCVSMARNVGQLVVTALLISGFPSAMTALAIQVGANAAGIAVYALYVRARLDVRPRFHRWDWPLFRALMAFSSFMLLNMIFDQVFWKSGQVVLGATCGAAAVAAYGVACQVISLAYVQLSTGVSNVFLPRITAIAAKTDDMEEINAIFKRVGHIQAIVVWGVCGAFIVLGREFIILWVGIGLEEAYPAIAVLMLSLSIPLVQNTGIVVLQAKNRMAFRAVVLTAAAIVDVAVCIPASMLAGVWGCALATAVILLIANGPIINAYYRFSIGIDVAGFYRSVLPLSAIVLLASLAGAVTSALIPEMTWASFALEAMMFSACYILLLFAKGFTPYERQLLHEAKAHVKARLA